MASNLAPGEFSDAKKRWRIQVFLDKIIAKTPFVLATGGKNVILQMTPEEHMKLGKYFNASNRTELNKFIFKDTDGGEHKGIARFKKTHEFGGGGFNLGNTGEGVFACAIAARFLSKTKNITPGDVTKLIKGLPASSAGLGKSVTATSTFESDNMIPSIKDILNLEIELSSNDMAHLKNDHAKYQHIIGSAVTYVNGAKVKKWADTLYKNNIVNTINVKSLGVSGATTTKVDTWVEIGDYKETPRKVDINISLKVGDVKQFGQVGGAMWEGQLKMWNSFGITPGDIGAKFEEHVGNKRYEEAFKLSFKSALDNFKPNTTSASEGIGKGIVFWATLNQDNVDLVSLKNSSVVVYRFKDAVKKIKDLALIATVDYGSGSKLPTIKFETKDSKNKWRLLVQVRARRDGTYFRTIVEKGDYLVDVIGEKIDIPSENQA
jgi:hypothetical protein